jgi:hypothetical protein
MLRDLTDAEMLRRMAAENLELSGSEALVEMWRKAMPCGKRGPIQAWSSAIRARASLGSCTGRRMVVGTITFTARGGRDALIQRLGHYAMPVEDIARITGGARRPRARRARPSRPDAAGARPFLTTRAPVPARSPTTATPSPVVSPRCPPQPRRALGRGSLQEALERTRAGSAGRILRYTNGFLASRRRRASSFRSRGCSQL